MIPPSGYLRRVIFTFMLVVIPMSLVLLFTYDVIKIYWNPGMVFQISIGYQEAPRKWAPNEAIPVAGPGHPPGHHRGREPGAARTRSRSSVANCSSSAIVPRATVRTVRVTVRSRSTGSPTCASRPT